MTAGHLGEYIASLVFSIDLEASASATAIDGRFTDGPPVGKSVNVKWYHKREGMLDLTTSELLDYCLVLTGPASAAVSSRGRLRPWAISNVYIFEPESSPTILSREVDEWGPRRAYGKMCGWRLRHFRGRTRCCP